MSEFTREPTKEEADAVHEIEERLIAAIPDGISGSIALSAVGQLVIGSFFLLLPEEIRLRTFDDFASHCRRAIAAHDHGTLQ